MVLRVLDWFPYDDKKWDLMAFIPDNSFKVIDLDTVSSFLPTKLGNYIRENDFAQYHLAVKVVDAQSTATMAYFNINRIDEEKEVYMIDQDQWFLAWHYGQSTPSASGALFSHGNWDGRTEPIGVPKSWVRHILDSGLNEHIPIPTLPLKASGSVDELIGTSHWRAREQLQAWLRGKDKETVK
jgi:hypothetical protein